MKLKRLLTGALSAVMALSVCAMPAMAADDENNAAATQKTGSLTITKYEQPKGENQDNENDAPKPLAGVTFTLYKIADINQNKNVDGSVSLDYDLVQELKDANITITWDSYVDNTDKNKQYDSAKLYTEIMRQINALDDTKKATLLESLKYKAGSQKDATATTDDVNGTAKFENLEDAIYMVEETSAPTQVTDKTANFLVSIPMMVKSEESDESTLTRNVTVYPKNVTVYGGVTLMKYGKVAGSSDDTKTAIAGAEFQLSYNNGTTDKPDWKAVDLTANGIKVNGAVYSADGASEGKITSTVDGVTITGLTPGEYRFMEISAPAGYVADTKTEHTFTLDKDGKISINGVKQDGTVISVINEKPDFDKDITKRDGTNDNHNADYGIGDKVPYTLTVKVPSTIAKLKTFYVTDTINTGHTDNPQLAYDENSFKVSCEGTDLKAGQDYTLTFIKDNNKEIYTGFKIDFKNGTNKLGTAYADKTITISYTAELLEGAVTTKAGNVNEAELVYSNKTNIDSAEDEPEGDKNTIHDEGVVYTFRAGILKKNSADEALSGVEFSFYKKYDSKTDGTLAEGAKSIHFMGEDCAVITGDAAKSLGLDSKEKWIEIKANEKTDETSGSILVKGLPTGEYYWVETKALDGYNLLKEPVKADLTVEYKAGWTEDKEYKNGVLTKREYKVDETTYPSDEVLTPITIVNRKGFTLPVTGGFGTLLFSGIGVLLVLAGVCVLFSMKKKNNRA